MRSLLRFGALGCALALTALPLAIGGGIGGRRRLLLAGHGQRPRTGAPWPTQRRRRRPVR